MRAASPFDRMPVALPQVAKVRQPRAEDCRLDGHRQARRLLETAFQPRLPCVESSGVQNAVTTTSWSSAPFHSLPLPSKDAISGCDRGQRTSLSCGDLACWGPSGWRTPRNGPSRFGVRREGLTTRLWCCDVWCAVARLSLSSLCVCVRHTKTVFLLCIFWYNKKGSQRSFSVTIFGQSL